MLSNIENKLKEKNIRPTAMRLLVLETLQKQIAAGSIQDLEAAFEKSDRTTLYRTLKTFEEKSIVHKIEDGTGVAKYALCEAGCNCEIDNDLHLHFYCTTCNETQCLTEQKLPHISLPSGFKAMDANLVVKGICNKCNGS
ncbi:Fur family transcriptional regulator [Salegentibacter sp. F188]|uniref:Fur family transcriptional regulator n=2 Tax=Autumnicola TaxID=3160927 RepID=A0ABU3E4J3_9FLAO|nr:MULTISPECIES: Fur family transcriptional regulator [Flavobacteriaceae]MDT0687367.1 Fur family transcriptional regulator [Zunongwangia sp. F225]MDT0690894.1 Fur family transcriptional regulator [Salegentibacter sp. F188]